MNKVLLVQNILRFEDILIDEEQTNSLLKHDLYNFDKADDEIKTIVQNLLNTFEYLEQITLNTLKIDNDLYILLNTLLAKDQALEVGKYRDGDCFIRCIETPIKPPSQALLDDNLSLLCNMTKENYKEIVSKVFCTLIRNQPFFDGNKRSTLMLCNLALKKKGLGNFVILNKDYEKFSTELSKFYTKNNRDILNFLKQSCFTD